MRKILVITVGSSPDPIISAYKEYEPNYVYFIVSQGNKGSENIVDGPGNLCGQKGNTIVAHAGIPQGSYEKRVIGDADSIEEVYATLEKIDEDIKARFPRARKAINYTGGTKSMTPGAVLFGTNHPDWELAFQHGLRQDSLAPASAGQWRTVNVMGIYAKGQLGIYRGLLDKYHYSTVDQLTKGIQQSGGLAGELLERIAKLRRWCQAFDAWDRFEHNEAVQLLQLVGGRELSEWIVLGKGLLGQIRNAEPYLKVVDVIANSERRYIQGRYDDAVGRLYRALEWLAQIRLALNYNIQVDRVDTAKLPEDLRSQYTPFQNDEGKIRLDLVKAYRLLAGLQDELGLYWKQKEEGLILQLNKRNSSILAHGQKPVNEADFRAFRDFVIPFILEGLRICGSTAQAKQLPGGELLDFCSL